MANLIDNKWCVVFPKASLVEPKAILYAFGPAGSNASIFRQWSEHIPPEILLVAIELPGHGNRSKEPLLHEVVTIAHQCVTKGNMANISLSYFVFGHSLGSLIAFEVARIMQQMYNRSPLALLISSHISPLAPPRHMFELESDPDSNQNLINYIIHTYKDTKLEKMSLSHPEMLAEMMPIFRADAYANENYDFQEGDLLDCPIHYFYGEEEEWVTATDINDWKQQSLQEEKFEVFKVPGCHHFISDVDNFLPIVRSCLLRFL